MEDIQGFRHRGGDDYVGQTCRDPPESESGHFFFLFEFPYMLLN